ncbi:hypothetical protein TNCV_2016221 [Trichonephila clavipes]|nr:hypothetical protein TNCV_2016221 [Trichonephila clavipes]
MAVETIIIDLAAEFTSNRKTISEESRGEIQMAAQFFALHEGLWASLLGFGWKRVAINSGPKDHVNEKKRESVTSNRMSTRIL